jgi:hypothetical protein
MVFYSQCESFQDLSEERWLFCHCEPGKLHYSHISKLDGTYTTPLAMIFRPQMSRTRKVYHLKGDCTNQAYL